MDIGIWWKKLWNPLSASAGWLLENFSPLGLINSLVPKDGYYKQVGISYGPLERQKLDVYIPQGEARNLPVVVFFYGGSWQSGRRQDYLFVAEALTARGLVTVIPDYRVYPEARFPTFVEDAALAVSWIRHHITDFGGDATRLVLMGHSAGAYISAMLALNSSYLGHVGLSAQEIKGFIGLAGPYDFLPLKSPRLIEIFGGADDIPETQPVYFVTSSGPPALLLHGNSDKLVRPQNTARLAQRLREVGGQVEEKIYPGYKHIRILIVLATAFQNGEPVMEDIIQFIRATI
ncbi:MAG: alpha/beta hydrolase [Desulfobacteraceae bacterium]